MPPGRNDRRIFANAPGRIWEVAEEKPRVDEVKHGLVPIVHDVGASVFDVFDLVCASLAAGQSNLRFVEIGPDHATAGTDAASELDGDVAAAADVETGHAGANARPLEERARGWSENARNRAQPLPSFDTAANHVVLCFHALFLPNVAQAT